MSVGGVTPMFLTARILIGYIKREALVYVFIPLNFHQCFSG